MSDILAEIEAYGKLQREFKEDMAQAMGYEYTEPSDEPSGEVLEWRGEVYDVPCEADLEAWVFDSVCETPDGVTVEPDHPDSWLRLLGLI